MKTNGAVDIQIHIFLTSALVGGEWSDSRLGRFNAEKDAPVTRWIERWVDPRTGLDDVEKEKKSCPYWDSNSDPSVFEPVTSRYTDCAIPALGGHLIDVLFRNLLGWLRKIFKASDGITGVPLDVPKKGQESYRYANSFRNFPLFVLLLFL
jgi:hypothetical protein